MKITELLLEYLDREKTLKNYGEKLEQRSKTDHSARGLDQNQLLDKFIESDPTGNKGTYVLWMINAYLKKGINYIEDLDRTRYALELYHKFKHKLPQEQRDINRIKSLSDLEDIVEQFKEQKTGKEVKKETKQEILNETEVLYNGPEGMVLIPKTERASCFWGQGTRWCTAATETRNQFHAYCERGPLYILLFKNNRKIQISFECHQIKDEKDMDAVNFLLDNSKYPDGIKMFLIALDHNLKLKIKKPKNHLEDLLETLKYVYIKDEEDMKNILETIRKNYEINENDFYYSMKYYFIKYNLTLINYRKTSLFDKVLRRNINIIKKIIEKFISEKNIVLKNTKINKDYLLSLYKRYYIETERYVDIMKGLSDEKTTEILEFIDKDWQDEDILDDLYISIIMMLTENANYLKDKSINKLGDLINNHIDKISEHVLKERVKRVFSNVNYNQIVKILDKINNIKFVDLFANDMISDIDVVYFIIEKIVRSKSSLEEKFIYISKFLTERSSKSTIKPAARKLTELLTIQELLKFKDYIERKIEERRFKNLNYSRFWLIYIVIEEKTEKNKL